MSNGFVGTGQLKHRARELLNAHMGFEGVIPSLQEQQRVVIASNRLLLDQVTETASGLLQVPEIPLTRTTMQEAEALITQMAERVKTIASIQHGTSVQDILTYLSFHSATEDVARYLEVFRPLIALALTAELSKASTSLVEQIAAPLDAKLAEADTLVGQLSQKNVEADTALKAIRGVSQVKSVSEHAKAYALASVAHNLVCLGAVLALLAISCWVTPALSSEISNVVTDVKPATWPALAQALYPRAPYAILYLLALLALIKIVVSERHNAIVAAQKRTALSTFETFANAADDETRRAILLTTTAFIFTPQGTGYTRAPVEVGSFKAFGGSVEPHG